MKRLLEQAHRFGMIQNEAEVKLFLDWYGRLGARRILEIGTHTGGFLYLLIAYGQQPNLVLSVDLPWQEHEYQVGKFRELYSDRVQFIVGSSHADETVKQVEASLDAAPAGPLDFLFLDGDHSYDGVRLDFVQYGALVKPGGWVGFHDINNGHECGRYYWNVAIKDRAHVEFGFGRTFGIGCVQL